VGIVASLLAAVFMGQLAGLWGLNGELLLGGLITGGSVGGKVTSAGLEVILREHHQRLQGNDEEVPQAPKIIPLVASALVVIPSPLVVFILASLAATTPPESPGTPPGRVAQTMVEPTSTVVPVPTIPASTFCTEVERTHASDTYVCVGSEPGDPVGAGGNWVMTAESSDFESIKATSRIVIVRIQDGSNPWFLQFEAPAGKLLVPAVYDAASTSFRDGKHLATWSHLATLDLTSRFASMHPCTGRLEVRVFDHSEADDASDLVNVNRFAANFEQGCGDSHTTLYGTIRINVPADETE
jgi:hypothetical protein